MIDLPDGVVITNVWAKQLSPKAGHTEYAISREGQVFSQAMIVRGKDQLPAMRFDSIYKRVAYSYPKSDVRDNSLWLSYAVNIENIAVTRLALESLSASAQCYANKRRKQL